MVDIDETAAQIVVKVSGETVVVTDMEIESDFDMERNYGSGQPIPNSVSFKKVEHGGSIELKGNKLTLNRLLFFQPDDTNIPEGFAPGFPKPFSMTITHLDGTKTGAPEAFVTNRGFQFSEGETAVTSYQFIITRMDGDPEVPNNAAN
jgi:hypothetical protein